MGTVQFTAGAEIDLASSEELSGHVADLKSVIGQGRQRLRPIYRNLVGAANVAANGTLDLPIGLKPSQGRMWNMTTAVLLGSDDHTGSGDTLTGAASTLAPLAGAALVTLATPPAGSYSITLKGSFGGTTVPATDQNNIGLYRAGVLVYTLPIIGQVAANSNDGTTSPPLQFQVNGAQSLTVQPIVNGSAAAVYDVSLTATRISSTGVEAALYAGNFAEPDLTSVVAFVASVPAQFTIASDGVWIGAQTDIFARIYGATPGAQMTLAVRVLDYPDAAVNTSGVPPLGGL